MPRENLLKNQLQALNLLVSRFLDYAELQVLEERTMTMKDWIKELDPSASLLRMGIR